MKSEILQTQKDFIILQAYEGDNEMAIIDTSANDCQSFALIVISLADADEEVCLIEKYSSTFEAALIDMHQFLINEYAGV